MPEALSSAADRPSLPTADELTAANIDPTTGLATDYLNHFNEVVMLLDLLADMPDMREDVLAWAPASYQDHFIRSGFRAKALAVAAYEAADPRFREPFDTVVAEIDAHILHVQAALREADDAQAARIGPHAAQVAQPLLMRAGGLIHGAAAAIEPGPAHFAAVA
jgi:hypothetical protein